LVAGIPVKFKVGVKQVIDPVADMVGIIGVVFEATPIVIVDEHAEIVLVTTTVYWPPVFTEAVAVVAPDVIPGPVQL